MILPAHLWCSVPWEWMHTEPESWKSLRASIYSNFHISPSVLLLLGASQLCPSSLSLWGSSDLIHYHFASSWVDDVECCKPGKKPVNVSPNWPQIMISNNSSSGYHIVIWDGSLLYSYWTENLKCPRIKAFLAASSPFISVVWGLRRQQTLPCSCLSHLQK